MNNPTATVDRRPAAAPIDWAAAERLAETLGPRSRGLVRARNVVALEAWLPAASASIRGRAPLTAALYDELAALVGVAGAK